MKKQLLKKIEKPRLIQEDEVEHPLTFTIKDTTLGSPDMMERPRLEVSIKKKETPKENPFEAGGDSKSENDVDTSPPNE